MNKSHIVGAVIGYLFSEPDFLRCLFLTIFTAICMRKKNSIANAIKYIFENEKYILSSSWRYTALGFRFIARRGNLEEEK